MERWFRISCMHRTASLWFALSLVVGGTIGWSLYHPNAQETTYIVRIFKASTGEELNDVLLEYPNPGNQKINSGAEMTEKQGTKITLQFNSLRTGVFKRDVTWTSTDQVRRDWDTLIAEQVRAANSQLISPGLKERLKELKDRAKGTKAHYIIFVPEGK